MDVPGRRHAPSLAALAVACVPWLAAAAPAAERLQGRLAVIHADAQPPLAPAAPVLLLRRDDDGRVVRLQPDGDAAALVALDRRRVTLEGQWLAATAGRAAAFRSLRATPAPRAGAGDFGGPVRGDARWLNLLCKFADIPDEPRPPSFVDALMAETAPGLGHYWRELSDGQVNIRDSRTLGWYTLPQPLAYYVRDIDGNGSVETDFQRLADDCTGAADAEVHFPDYYGVNLMFNDAGTCCYNGGAYFLDEGGDVRLYGMTWLSAWVWGSHNAVAHEMGHGFGLPHSSGNHLVYNDPWDIMGAMWARCERNTDPVLGCLGYHTIGYHKDRLGWIPETQRYVAPPDSNATLRLERLERPRTPDPLVAVIPIRGSATHFYTVETRRRTGYDVRLMGAGVVIHEVDTFRPEPADVVDGDGNFVPDDEGSRWRPGETFRDEANGIEVQVQGSDPTGHIVTIVRATDVLLADDFESGDLGAWDGARTLGDRLAVTAAAALRDAFGLAARIDDARPLYVEDLLPRPARRYRARFLLDPSGLAMAEGDAFIVLAGYAGAEPALRMELRRAAGRYRLRLRALQNDGTWAATRWARLAGATQVVELDWTTASASWLADGQVTLWLDDREVAQQGELYNHGWPLDRVRLGAVGGVDAGTDGRFALDAFEARDERYIGPPAP